MKFKHENKELVSINKIIQYSELRWYEKNKIMSFILQLYDEIVVLKKELEKIKK